MKIIVLVCITGLGLLFLQASPGETAPANKAELGKILFGDPILSRDRTISCASCHKPDFAFSDTSAVSAGVRGRKGTRNTPSAMNMLLQRAFFWDGRARTLEEQALAPIENVNEMDLPVEKAVTRLRKSKIYNAWFRKIFNREPDRENLAAAIAAFERTLETSDSPFDRWKFSDDPGAVSEEVKNGFALFNGKANCVKCHFGADFTQNDFRNIGLFNGRELNDSGRMLITRNPEDLGRFKVGSLRNIAITAPYMHNGMFRTLEEVIAFYNEPDKVIAGSINRDSLLAKPLGLTTKEKNDIAAFLFSLTDERFMKSSRKTAVGSP